MDETPKTPDNYFFSDNAKDVEASRFKEIRALLNIYYKPIRLQNLLEQESIEIAMPSVNAIPSLEVERMKTLKPWVSKSFQRLGKLRAYKTLEWEGPFGISSSDIRGQLKGCIWGHETPTRIWALYGFLPYRESLLAVKTAGRPKNAANVTLRKTIELSKPIYPDMSNREIIREIIDGRNPLFETLKNHPEFSALYSEARETERESGASDLARVETRYRKAKKEYSIMETLDIVFKSLAWQPYNELADLYEVAKADGSELPTPPEFPLFLN